MAVKTFENHMFYVIPRNEVTRNLMYRQDKTFAQLLLCHCEERQRRGNLLYYQYAMRLLHGACTERSECVRNDREHIVQRFKYVIRFLPEFTPSKPRGPK